MADFGTMNKKIELPTANIQQRLDFSSKNALARLGFRNETKSYPDRVPKRSARMVRGKDPDQ